MKHLFSPLVLILCCVILINAQTSLLAQGDTAIYKTLGGTFEDEFTSVVYDNDSNLLFCGHSSSISEFGSKAILVKTDSFLNTLWSISYGDYAVSNFMDLIQDEDTYVAVGSILNPISSYDILVAAFNEDGELLWDKHIGGDNWDLANSISIINGGYLITGDTYTSSGKNGYVIKLNTEGEIIWENNYGEDLNATLLDGKESVSGDLVFCGNKVLNDSTSQYWFLKTSSEGSVILETVSDSTNHNSFNSIVSDLIDESYYVCGHMYNPITESEDAIISKLNSEGVIEFTSMLESPGFQSFYSIELGSPAELVCVGITENGDFGNEGKDILMKRHTTNDLFIDQRSIGTAGNELGNGAVRIDNGYIICGYTDDLGEGQNDGFMVRTRISGSVSSNAIEEELLENVTQTVGIIQTMTTYDNFKMTSFNGTLMFSEDVTEIKIYSLTGELVFFSDTINRNQCSPSISEGLYLIVTDGIYRGKHFWP